MLNRHSSATPRAHSIVALGFSKATRRLLMKLGFKTVNDLADVDVDHLKSQGADTDQLAEIEEKRVEYRLDEENEPAADADGDKLPDAHDADGASDQPNNEHTISALDLQAEPICQEATEAQPAATDPKPLRFSHKALNACKAECALNAENADEESDPLTLVASNLALHSDRWVALHSLDKQALRSIVHKAADFYEDLLVKKSNVESFFPIPLAGLSLSTRTSNVLEKRGVKTVGDLCELGEEGLLALEHAGVSVIHNVEDVLNSLDPQLVVIFTETKNGERVVFENADANKEPVPTCLHSLALDLASLSGRAKNALKYNKLTTVGEILEVSEEGLLQLKNVGLKSAHEILDIANAQAEAFMATHPDENQMENPEEASAQKASPACAEEALASKVAAIRSLLLDLSDLAAISPCAAESALEQGIGAEELRSAVLRSFVISTLEKNPWGLTLDELAAIASHDNVPMAQSDLQCKLDDLAASSLAQERDGLWSSIGLPTEEAIARHISKPIWAEMTIERFSGKTLEEIGAAHGVSRGRAQQVLAKTLTPELLNGTRAGQFFEYMKRYDLNEREVCCALGATADEWKTVSLFKKAALENNPGILPASALLEDRSIPSRVRIALEKAIHHGSIKIDGEYIPERRLDLMLYTLKRHGSRKSVSESEFTALYEQLLHELGIEGNCKLQLLERTFQNFRLQKCVLSGYPKRLRYYDFDKFDIRGLINDLGFEDYEGKEISTKVFLVNKPDLLSEYEIEDAYELHSLLRSYAQEAEKTGEALPYSMTRRMPTIRIGDCNRERQVIELVRELSPISVDGFAATYEEEYGVEQASVKADYYKFFAPYVVNGVLSMNLEPFTEEEQIRMMELFPGDFYRLSQVEAAYKREFPEAGTSRFNAFSLKKAGFKTYSSCVLRDTWENQAHYFDSLTLAATLFDENSVPENVASSHPYQNHFYSLIRDRRLLPYEGSVWITEKGLADLGISEAELLDFADSAAAFCAENGIAYCTARSLRNNGFCHGLFDYEFSDEFYVALICTNDTRFNAVACSGKKIACLDDAETTIAAFLETQVGEGESIAVEDLIGQVENDFGVTVRRDKALAAPSRSDLYYSEITDMIYKNRETFIKEVE